ncbi:MAG: ParB/RepB/Spo0J family partition protein [Burkholderiales bacterium]|nr:MAG: ParB/RepB/Spo0J family partition protein [Burkholderiales bacterium]
MTSKRPKGLGRGLEALLGPSEEAGSGATRVVPLARLRPGRYQPRTRMDEGSLQELAASIRSHGVMQPIIVRSVGGAPATGTGAGPGEFEIIAGERRFRAAGLAGLDEVPVLVREVGDRDALALALIENIQRENLNPLEEAQAIKRLIDEFGFTHEQASDAIGRSRSATSNLLRLLNLAPAVQTMLLAGDIEMGHARALLALDGAQQVMLAHRVHERGMSVREAERLVARAVASAATDPASTTGRPGVGQRRDRDLDRLAERLSEALGANVRLSSRRSGGGQLTIAFSSPADFEALLDRLGLARVLSED